jgi:uncharacterized Zn finger protein (UPF0148 family)
MRKCPNCGQVAVRTKDWACQWCGYPLFSASYEISKTYKGLREERLQPELKSTPPTIEVTVDELYAAYKADKTAADAKFLDKLLKLTGIVARIVATGISGMRFIVLVGTDEEERQVALCEFNRRHGSKVTQLTTGQTVTVQGRCEGYQIHIIMKDCDLIP